MGDKRKDPTALSGRNENPRLRVKGGGTWTFIEFPCRRESDTGKKKKKNGIIMGGESAFKCG